MKMLRTIIWGTAAVAHLALGAALSCNSTAPVAVHPIPAGIASRDTYSVSVRSLNSRHPQHYSVDPFLFTVAEANITTGAKILHDTSVAAFDFCGPIEVLVTYNNAPIDTAEIRPHSYDISPRVHGRTIKFTLDEPKHVVVQVNNDIWDVLHLFTHPIETNPPAPSDPAYLYFSPGINNHTIAANLTDGQLRVPAGKTIYVAPGATINLALIFQNVSSTGIRGRGLVRTGGIRIRNSTDILISDVLLFNSNVATYMSSDVTVRGIPSISSGQWGDGIDFYCSRNALVDNVFLRNSDDNVALYQHRDDAFGDSSNITVQNAVLWADYAHPINIGTHGNTPNPEVMDGVVIRNIDVLDHRERQMWYQGCLSINAGDSNLIQNVHVDGMRVENFRDGQLVNLRIMDNAKYSTSPGRGIRNVYIKDLSYHGTNANPSLILGYDATHKISNVTFENLVVNGVVVSDTMVKPSWYYTADLVPMFVNEHVEGLKFIAS